MGAEYQGGNCDRNRRAPIGDGVGERYDFVRSSGRNRPSRTKFGERRAMFRIMGPTQKTNPTESVILGEIPISIITNPVSIQTPRKLPNTASRRCANEHASPAARSTNATNGMLGARVGHTIAQKDIETWWIRQWVAKDHLPPHRYQNRRAPFTLRPNVRPGRTIHPTRQSTGGRDVYPKVTLD